MLPEPVTENPIRNPLFCFAFSLDFSKGFSENKLAELYQNKANFKILPNLTVVLKRGIYVLVDEEKLRVNQIVIKLYPEFSDPEKHRWILLSLAPEECLAYLIFMLTQHINDTVLERVSAMQYASSMITIYPSQISPI